MSKIKNIDRDGMYPTLIVETSKHAVTLEQIDYKSVSTILISITQAHELHEALTELLKDSV